MSENNMDISKTVKVVFLLEKDNTTGKSTGVPFAYFPGLDWNLSGDKTCYAHLGQHGPCAPDYAKGCKRAPLNATTAALLKELRAAGYDSLKIENGWAKCANCLHCFNRYDFDEEAQAKNGGTPSASDPFACDLNDNDVTLDQAACTDCFDWHGRGVQ